MDIPSGFLFTFALTVLLKYLLLVDFLVFSFFWLQIAHAFKPGLHVDLLNLSLFDISETGLNCINKVASSNMNRMFSPFLICCLGINQANHASL